MKWDVEVDSDDFVLVTGEDNCTNGNYDGVISELLMEFCIRILPLKHPRWNYIKIELWPDSGRVIVFPADSDSDERLEIGVCQVIIKDYLDRFGSMAGSTVSADVFERFVHDLNQEIIDSIARCIEGLRLDRRFIKKGVRVKIFEWEDTVPAFEIDI